MIKAGGKEHVIIGLSKRNIELLMQGKPIIFEGSEVGVPGKKFLIFYGVTEDAILDDLREAGIVLPGL